MAKNTISHSTLTKGILYAVLFFILVVFLRILLIFIPPIIVRVSPKVVSVGQTITLWGFMGSENVRNASTLMLNNAPINDANIQKWNFFSIHFKITEQDTQKLKNSIHGIVYLQYKKYRSTRFLISLSHEDVRGRMLPEPSFPKLSMRNNETVYPKDTLVFSFNTSPSNTNEVFIEEYFFTVKTKNVTHTLYSHEWNTFSSESIEFAIPISLFPIPPKEHVNADIHVMYKNKIVSTHQVLLTVPPILSSAAYEFEVEFAYDAASEKYPTTIIPLSRLWQRVRFADKQVDSKGDRSDGQFRTAISQGFIKNFEKKKLSFLITNYPFHTFAWKNLLASDERAAFFFAPAIDDTNSALAGAAASVTDDTNSALAGAAVSITDETNEQLAHNAFSIPYYLRDSDGYFNTALNEVISRSVDNVRENALSVEDLIKYFFSHESERILSNAARQSEFRISEIMDRILRGSPQIFQRPKVFQNVKKLAISAALLRNYGIPAQVVIGFIYDKRKESVEKLSIKPAVWLEVFTSSYGIIPLHVTKNASTISVMRTDYRFIGYAVLEQMIYLVHRNQKPYFFTELRSFTLRN